MVCYDVAFGQKDKNCLFLDHQNEMLHFKLPLTFLHVYVLDPK